MRTVKYVEKRPGLPDVACGCEYTVDGRDQEQWSRLCIPHKKEFDMRQAAARVSCSHANRDLIEQGTEAK